MLKIHRIGLIANPGKPRWKANLRQAAALVRNAERVAIAPQLEPRVGLKSQTDSGTLPAEDAAFHNCIRGVEQTDLILVIGGDGTMLHVARTLSGGKTPILGINTGNLGFLTAATMSNLRGILEQIWQGDFAIESRPFLEAVLSRPRSTVRSIAINDFVISRSELSRMIQLDVFVDGKPLTTYQCDGLIICSPTGSTAYSLSAGGPIVSPNTEAIALTPICPHTLSNRSVIVPLKSTVRVAVGAHRPETLLTGDGQVSLTLKQGDIIQFQQSRRRLRLLSVGVNEFFQTLRQKMKWSGSNV